MWVANNNKNEKKTVMFVRTYIYICMHAARLILCVFTFFIGVVF